MRLFGWMTMFRANGPLDKFLMWLGLTDAPLKLLYTYPAALFGMVYVLLPFMIYSIYASAEKLDRRLIEAARDLGSNPVGAFIKVSLPLTAPGLLSGVIMTFVPSMGMYFITTLLGGGTIPNVGLLITEAQTRLHDLPFAAALAVTLLILASLFLFLYRKVTGTDELEGIV